MVRTSTMAELARQLAGPHTSSPSRGPRPQASAAGLADVLGVNPYTAELHIMFGGVEYPIPGVRYVHAYSPDNLPRKGDVAVIQTTSNGGVTVLGRHVLLGIPDPVVLL